jgi:oligosaccharide 4-alpha-D-glucosyltransferase
MVATRERGVTGFSGARGPLTRARGHEGTRARESGIPRASGLLASLSVPSCPRALVPSLLFLIALLLASFAQAADYRSHSLTPEGLVITSDEATLTLRFHQPGAIEAFYEKPGVKQLPSFSIADAAAPALTAELAEAPSELVYRTPQLTARIQKSPLRVSYWRGDELLLAEEQGGYAFETVRGFRFALSEGEKLVGGGQRVLGMDRRGHRLPLYNKPHYGYTTQSEQMYFSMPAVLSSRKYLLLFDNSASGFMDLGKTEPGILEFQAVGGRTGYLVFAAPDYPGVMQQYVKVTGTQPLPPRWALGNYASRFGYRSEAEVRATVQKFIDLGIPLDAVVIDLYWFGKDIQGHLGKLDWDRNTFPTPVEMMADLKAQGVNTILVTEPFILTTSTRWQEAVAAGVLAKDLAGRPKTFDFYFGNTGLIDVFKPEAAQWFWGIYAGLMQQGVAGWWGDLGEPEVHPDDTVHVNGIAGEVHNAYGHTWAKLLYENHVQAYPERRPFIMMRAGAPGSQRYGMIPWTGDVDRSWGGLKPQVELALQMGLLGMGWTHSDLGGFAGGKRFDRELYLRWLQYGVFQPVFRPHAQDHIPSEPVFHDRKTIELARQAIQLRYRLLPYLYTLAWENSTRGLPLMRPLFFADASDASLIDRSDAYFWGDAFLVRPITDKRTRRIDLALPAGVWFDFHDGSRFEGGQTVRLKTRADGIPVLVRAGAFVPMVEPVQNTTQYSTAKLELHHWTDASVASATGRMYDDDGATRTAIASGAHELLSFASTRSEGGLTIDLGRQGGEYAGRPAKREITLVLHGWQTPPADLTVDGQAIAADYDARSQQLRATFQWSGPTARLVLK